MSIDKFFDKLPPHAIEAEMSLLGSLMVGGIEAKVLMQGVYADIVIGDFFLPKHQAIYKCLSKVNQCGAVDLVLLNEEIQSLGVSDEIGGVDYLIELAESVPTSINAPHYSRILKHKSRLRKVIDSASKSIVDAYGTTPNAITIIDNLISGVSGIQSSAGQSKPEFVSSIITRVYDDIKKREPGSYPGLRIGMPSIDSYLCGVADTDLVLIGARPSIGKSALATTMGESIARQGKGVLFFSLEMGKDQHGVRLLSSMSGVPMRKLRVNDLAEFDHVDIQRSMARYDSMPFEIEDTPAISPNGIRRVLREVLDQRDVSAVFVDYLQIMSADGRHDMRSSEVGAISAGLKRVAKEFEVPVFALCQLKRPQNPSAKAFPNLSDLKESGSLEQDADTVLLLHRQGYYTDHDGSPSDTALIVAKQRQGACGPINGLTWDGSLCRFNDTALIEKENNPLFLGD